MPKIERPPCPECQVGMIVVDGFGLELEKQTVECLKCGHVERPDAPKKVSQLRVSGR
jgi:Zn ribbon nucleic-acid-binding protein